MISANYSIVSPSRCQDDSESVKNRSWEFANWYLIRYHSHMIVNDLKNLLQNARKWAGLGLREAARLGGTSHATLLAYERGDKSPGIDTLTRLLHAQGFELEVRLHKRIRSVNGLERGEELIQVLELAEQFPSKRSKSLHEPAFGNDT